MKAFNIKTILIPTDFSETSFLAVEHAAFMAKMFKADIVLLHVFEKNWEKFNIVEPNLSIEVPSDLSDKIEKRLDDLTVSIRREYGVKATSICTDGNIFHEIVKGSQESKADLIVMGTHGVSGFEEFFVGSNTYKVVTQSVCPVLSVQTHAKKIGFNNIILPIDHSFHSREKAGHAVALAKKYGSKIHILGLYNAVEDEVKKLEIKLDQVQSYIENQGVSFSRKTIEGENQAAMTFDAAKAMDADLIMIMTDQDSNGFFIGPYAQQIVNHSRIPVLSIRPTEGQFESPSLGGGSTAF